MVSTIEQQDIERPWSSTDLMARYGYSPKSVPAFWNFVYRHGVPHVRLTPRKIIFPRAAVLAWEAKRSVGKAVAS
jgi:hypothetical protein